MLTTEEKREIDTIRNGFKNIGKVLEKLIIIFSVLVFIWFIVSWFEIISQNTSMTLPTVLSKWNLFELTIYKNIQ